VAVFNIGIVLIKPFTGVASSAIIDRTEKAEALVSGRCDDAVEMTKTTKTRRGATILVKLA